MNQRQVKIKPESEISSHITLMSVISGLFYPRYLHCRAWPVPITTRVMSLPVQHEIIVSYFMGHVPKDIIVKISRVE